MTVQIAIAIPAPFVTAQQFADLAKMPVATVKNKIRRGEFPIRKKKRREEKRREEQRRNGQPWNPVDKYGGLNVRGAAGYKGNLVVNIEGVE